MSIFLAIITTLSAAIAAYATFRIMLQGYEPGFMDNFVLYNPRSSGTRITLLYTKTGTFAELARDENGKGYYRDSGQSQISLNIYLYANQKYDLPWRYLYVNGERVPYTLSYHLDFFHGFSFHNYKVEASPQ